MSDATGVFYFIGAVVTLVAFAALFAKRYPGQPGRLWVGIAIGIAVMFLWPVSLWVAFALWLTGFARPRTPGIPSHQEPPAGLPKKAAIPLCAVGSVITLVIIGAASDPVAEPGVAVAAPPGTTTASPDGGAPVITVVDVVDGDTIKLNDGRTVRIIGIDTPETVAPGKPVECWGPEATAFARQTLLNEAVTLVGDPTQDLEDAYGRTLSYVMLPDGRDFSVLAAEAGHARAYLFDVPAQRYDAISAAESRARAAGLGLWGPVCTPAQPQTPQTDVPPTQLRPAAPHTLAPQPAAPQPAPAPEPEPEPEPVSEPDPQPSVYYKNCDEARAAGAAPIHEGEPGYRPDLDRNHDGVACESR